MSEYHVPIMVDEIMSLLQPERGGIYVDGTLGGGGHTKEILKRLPVNARHFGIDRDSEAINEASATINDERFTALRGNFFDIKGLLSAQGVSAVDGILLDLGVSSHQLDDAKRGFSYNQSAPLDMRMDMDQALTAYQVVNGYSEEELSRIIADYGEERFAGRVASAIVRRRELAPIETTDALAEIVKYAIPVAAARKENQHPARRTFQAIRIEVNGELSGLEQAISDAHDLLGQGGVLAIITFHSLEDRIVKNAFKRFENPCTCDPKAPVCTCGKTSTAQIITKKPLTASAAEIKLNARSRSAKLRAIKKL